MTNSRENQLTCDSSCAFGSVFCVSFHKFKFALFYFKSHVLRLAYVIRFIQSYVWNVIKVHPWPKNHVSSNQIRSRLSFLPSSRTRLLHLHAIETRREIESPTLEIIFEHNADFVAHNCFLNLTVSVFTLCAIYKKTLGGTWDIVLFLKVKLTIVS